MLKMAQNVHFGCQVYVGIQAPKKQVFPSSIEARRVLCPV